MQWHSHSYFLEQSIEGTGALMKFLSDPHCYFDQSFVLSHPAYWAYANNYVARVPEF